MGLLNWLLGKQRKRRDHPSAQLQEEQPEVPARTPIEFHGFESIIIEVWIESASTERSKDHMQGLTPEFKEHILNNHIFVCSVFDESSGRDSIVKLKTGEIAPGNTNIRWLPHS